MTLATLTTTWAQEEPQSEALAQTLRIGVLESFAPYYLRQFETREHSGLARDVIDRIAASVGRQAEIRTFGNWHDLIQAARSGAIDIAPIVPEHDEARQVFSIVGTIHTSSVSIYVRKDNRTITTRDSLIGRRVSSVRHDIGDTLMRKFRGELSIRHADPAAAISSLVAGTSDAVIVQNDVAQHNASILGVTNLLRVIEPELLKLNLGVAVSKTRPDLTLAVANATELYLQSDEFKHDRRVWLGPLDQTVDLQKILVAFGSLLFLSILGLALWRYFSVMKLNAALDQAVQKTHAAELRFRDYAQAAADWFFEFDEQYKFTYASPRYSELFALNSEKIIGRTLREVHEIRKSPDGDRNWREFDTILKRQEDWQDLVFSFAVDDGSTRTIQLNGRALFEDDGVFRGYRGVGRDISSRVETERALQQSQKMEAVGQLTGGIAHDFNNLLAVLLGNIELLQGRVSEDQRAVRYLKTAREATERGAKLTHRLLAFSRGQPLEQRIVDLNKTARQMRLLIEPALGRGIELKFDLSNELGRAILDESQLQNVLLNLAINARDAMPSGGVLTISTSNQEILEHQATKHLEIAGGRFAQITVSDTGTGIPPEILDKVVEPFFTTKEVDRGTGLGLSMAYGFAQQSNGFMSIESREGAGTQVHLHFPISEEDEFAVDAMPRQPAAVGGNETLLVVDDDENVRNVTVERLLQLGYDVTEAVDGTSALQMLLDGEHGQDIQLLITDIVMPGGMTGVELASEARRRHPDLRVLFVSGFSDQTLEPRDKGSFLPKPHNQSELAQMVRTMLEAQPDMSFDTTNDASKNTRHGRTATIVK